MRYPYEECECKQRITCVACGSVIMKRHDDPCEVHDAMRVYCMDCAHEVLGRIAVFSSNGSGYFHFGTGGGRRVVKETKTH